jgi:pimeloyl-ACP methyl ester carboxylesterase
MADMRGVVDFGGRGQGILLLHGLMGRATTWWCTARWLVEHGRVVGIDARAHGRNPHRARADTTEQFAQDAADRIRELDLAPAIVIGHSMGGLHALAVAADHPELVRAIVVEDMAPDYRGRTAEVWRPVVDAWPPVFSSIAHVRQFFGRAGDYFAECVEEREDGYHLLTDVDELFEIAQEWGRRDFWAMAERVRCPVLAVQAGDGPTPVGQMAELTRRTAGPARHVTIDGSGHLVHDDAPGEYRRVVEEFLSELPVGVTP